MNRIPPQAVEALKRAIGAANVLHTPEDLIVFEYDGTIERGQPQVVVFPNSTEEVAACVKIARQFDLPVVPRGAGTGLSGGAVAAVGGVLDRDDAHAPHPRSRSSRTARRWWSRASSTCT